MSVVDSSIVGKFFLLMPVFVGFPLHFFNLLFFTGHSLPSFSWYCGEGFSEKRNYFFRVGKCFLILSL